MICKRCEQREALKNWGNFWTVPSSAPKKPDPAPAREPFHPGPLCVECVIEQLGPLGAPFAEDLRQFARGELSMQQLVDAVRAKQSKN